MNTRRIAAMALVAAWLPAAHAAPLHHAVKARLDPATGALSLSDTITLSGRRQVTLRLAPWQHIVSVRLNGREVSLATPPRLTLPDNGRHRITMTLRGQVPNARRGGAMSGADGAYLPGFGGWLPDSGDALVAHRLTISVPEPYRVVSTGRRVAETSTSGTRRAVFTSDRPSELPSLFAGRWRVRERKAGAVTLRTYLHDDIAKLATVYLDSADAFIRRYSAEIGPYPYPAFSIVSSPLPVGLGFPSLTYVGRMVLPLPFMRGRSLAHEVLHSWWGNGVAVDTSTGNWAEGLTTYMADYALAADRGEAAARAMRTGWLRAFAALPAARDIAVRAFRVKRHDASQVIGYNKTAFLFHMLRGEIGEAAFAAGLRAFWREHRFHVAGWKDLRAAFEREAGRDLGQFFAQWLDRPGAPEISLGAVAVTPDADRHRLSFAVRQKPPYYRLTLAARIVTDSGEQTRRIAIDGAATSVAFTLAARPRALHLDPGFDVFRRLTPAETPPILRDVTLAANATSIIAATGSAGGAARALAARLMDSTTRTLDAAGTGLPKTPLLIIGTDGDVARLLKRTGLEPAPPEIATGGTARVWTHRRPEGLPVLIVSASDERALRALLRPLPHYTRRSYIVFDGRKAIRRGIWPLGASPLSRTLTR
ncbi:MAG: M1 family aminopeptidase [Alphaproteobacteria bacterium]